MLANAEAKWAVLQAVDGFLDHIANGRLLETLACFTDDPDAALIGSEVGEVAVGPRALRAFFTALYAQPYRILFALPERRVSLAGNVAWFTGEGTCSSRSLLEAEVQRAAGVRLAGVLERRRERWLWQLFSGSEPRSARGMKDLFAERVGIHGWCWRVRRLS